MSAPAQNYLVRWRIAGAAESAWVTRVVPASGEIRLEELTRGVTYDIQICAVARNGRKSNWVDVSTTVANTSRQGAAALPTNAVANQASMWDLSTSVTYAASSNASGASTATISVSAGTLVIGGSTINYAPSSATVSGTAGSSAKYYLYYDDPQLTGGALTLGLATNIVESANVDGRIAIAPVTLNFPAAGGSSSGGGSIGGGGGSGGAGSCPWVEAWVFERARGFIQAGDVRVNDWLLCPAGEFRQVVYSQRRTVPGVRIVTEQLHTLTCSDTAPILTDRGFVHAPAVMGCSTTITSLDDSRAEVLVDVVHLGDIEVQHITLDAQRDADHVFLVGDDAAYLLPHHNLKAVTEPV